MGVMRFLLPWPDKALSPNSRAHWAPKATATKKARTRAASEALAAGAVQMRGHGPFSVSVVFCPIGRGPNPDLDNCIASFKASQDGLADALQINDRDLNPTYAMGERCKSGAVIVEVSFNTFGGYVQ